MRHNKEVVAVGFRTGEIEDMEILTGKPAIEDVHTISLYIGSSRQDDFIDYIISLKPKRVIFNPGTVNPAFMAKLQRADIEPVSSCMLVMLNDGTF